MFVPEDFCRFLLNLIGISSLFYERAFRFYGQLAVHASLAVKDGVGIFDGPLGSAQRLGGAYLFDPPLNRISRDAQVGVEISTHPITKDRVYQCLETVLTAIARPNGSVLSKEFREGLEDIVDASIARLTSARNR